jgi:hypothetical protein
VSAPAGAVRNVRALQALLAERYPDARPLVERDAQRALAPVATGLAALDAALPGGGLPRGKLTAWAPEGGAAAVLRSACRLVLAGGERAAWVDATRLLTAGWAPAGRRGGGRAPAAAAARAARATAPTRCAAPSACSASGAFALVVLEPPPGRSRWAPRRCAWRARRATAARRSWCSPSARRWRAARGRAARRARRALAARPFGPAAPVAVRADVRVRALGWNARADVTLAVAGYDLRDALEPGPDRRGVARGTAGRPGGDAGARPGVRPGPPAG